MDMASVELGGYELRDDSVYVTDNFLLHARALHRRQSKIRSRQRLSAP